MVLIKYLLSLSFEKTHPRGKVLWNEFSAGLCLQVPVSRRHAAEPARRATNRKLSGVLGSLTTGFGPPVILTLTAESNTALAEGTCSLAHKMKPPKHCSVGPEESSYCKLNPCIEGFFYPHNALNCFLVLKMSIFSYFPCPYHKIGRRFLAANGDVFRAQMHFF